MTQCPSSDAGGSLAIVNTGDPQEQTASILALDDEARAATVSPRRRAWRAPLLAAAAVVAIAVTTTAIATGAFRSSTGAGRGTDPAAAPSSAEQVTTNAAGEVGVPFNASPDIHAVATGPGSGALASSLIESSADSAAQPTVWLKFTGGAPPTAILETRFQTADKLQTVQYNPTQSDGTPLGYLAHMVSVHGGPAGAVPPGDVYLWGVVGPEVAQIQVMAALGSNAVDAVSNAGPATNGGAPIMPAPATPGSTPPAATSAHWRFDSGFGTAFSLAGSETAPWVAMPDGYHAFAVHLSTDVDSIDVMALGTAGEELQIRRFDLSTGHMTDLLLPPPSWSDEAPLTTSTAAPKSLVATTATGLPDAPSSSEAPSSPATPGDLTQSDVRCLGCGSTAGTTNDPPTIGGPPPTEG